MKNHYCLLKKFNNYFNRKVIKYENLSDYQENSEAFFIPTNTDGYPTQFDFNPNDNVMTAIIVNDLPFDPDYLLVLDADLKIVSRWFVLESNRNRQKQWSYQVRRDVIVDNLNALTTAPVFVQKAWLDENNPLILNDEGMNFNRIKTSETLLKDFSGSAWYVAYLSKNKGGTQIDLQIPAGEVEGSVNLSTIASEMGISEAYLTELLNFGGDTVNPARFVKNIGILIWTRGASIIPDMGYYFQWNDKLDFNSFNYDYGRDSDGDIFPLFIEEDNGTGSDREIAIGNGMKNAVFNNRAELLALMPSLMNKPYMLTTQMLNTLRNYIGKYVYYLGKYYKLDLFVSGTDTVIEKSMFATTQYQVLDKIAHEAPIGSEQYFRVASPAEGEQGAGYRDIRTIADRVFIQLNEVSDDPNIPIMDLGISSARKQTLDQQYDIICFPANDVVFELKDGDDNIYTFTSVGDICRKMVTKLGIQEDANVYDIQLLPYCPLDKIVELYDLVEGKDYNLIKDHNDPTKLFGTVFYIPSASFQQRLNYSLTIKESMKMDNECDLYRIIAPNYQGVFEFNVAKNGGSVDFFTAYCTYKPYTPFIKVAPDFQFVYGSDYNDDRGLICAGDFSMPRVNSAWESYQLQNKNYQNIFNRDIQNLEIMQGIERRQHNITGGLGIFNDAVKGAVAGGMTTASPYGAIAGAVLGAGASAAGYLVDKDIMAIQHREQRSLAIDKFNYQLGNIKALPYTITKVGSFDISSKIFPVLVYYTCTDKEREAMRLKLKYESMTVMKIGYFGDFYRRFDEPKYFKGELIRCDDIAEDNHMLEAIYSEIMKGVYM